VPSTLVAEVTLEGSEEPRLATKRTGEDTASETDRAVDHRSRGGRADRRDQVADERDRIADERDHVADQRDRTTQLFEVSVQVGNAADGGERSAVARAGRASRHQASLRRRLSAVTRRQADRERGSERLLREVSDPERETVDDLTGLLRRNDGFAELTRELARAERSAAPLIAAFVDIDGLKAINDTHGHVAGDATLVAVSQTLRRELRAYDIIFRYGGDEIVCVLPGIGRDEATKRFRAVNLALSTNLEYCSITVGLAEMRPGDVAHSLVARADAAMYVERRSSH
jgi:diguanylate cyclase (GGDEF)-like protein